MRTSANGLRLLAAEEGLRLAPYNDSAGNATVGVGHLLHKGPVTAADRQRYRGFTRADAMRLLKRDVAIAEGAVNSGVSVRLSQNEFDALVSLTFNIGTGGFAGSTVRKRLNAGDRKGAADAILMWRIPPELLGRRRRERALFLRASDDPLDHLTRTELRWAREYDALRRADRDRQRRAELRAAMRARRKVIWRAAQPKAKGGDGKGWGHAHRRERYAALLHRSS